MVADALGEARHEGLELQIGTLVEDELPGIGIADKTRRCNDDVGRDVQFLGDEVAQVLRQRPSTSMRITEPRRLRFRALSKTRTRSSASFLDFDVAVTDDTDEPFAQYVVTRKQAWNEVREQASPAR